ncbi:hypothetical protein [Streptomyces adustus]
MATIDAYLVFEDEAGFSMTPPTARTWSRRGHTHLMHALKRGLREVQYRPALIDGCLAGTGLATAGPDRCL